MLIAVSANNSNVDSPFEPRFGRAAGFMIFDSDTGESRFVDNSSNAEVAGGAGVQTAQLLADQGVQVVISGTFGPKAEQALQAGKIEMVTADSGTVRELAENYATETGVGQLTADLKRSPQSLNKFGGGCRRMGGTGRGMGMAGGGRGKGGGGRGMGGGGGMGRRS